MTPDSSPDVIADVLLRIERMSAPRPEGSVAAARTTDDSHDQLVRLAAWWRAFEGSRPVSVTWLECAGPDVASGIIAADRAVDAGATLLVPSPPQADDICARAAIAVLCHRDAAATTHQPHGMTDRDWTIRCARVRDDIARLMPFRGEPQALLTELADAAVSSMVGALLSASCRRTPSLISGTRAWAAAVIADRLSPAASTWWRAASTSPDPADALARERTDVCPGLPLDIDSADDSAARATIALLDVALSS